MSAIIIVFLYFLLLCAIAWFAGKPCSSTSKAESDYEDFSMGGRQMNPWVTALSAHASDMSAWLFMTLPMLILSFGGKSIWLAMGLFLGMGVNWFFVAKRLRISTESVGATTLSQWFEKAFNDKKGVLRSLSSAMLTLFILHYLAAGMIAMGLLFEELFHFPYEASIIGALCFVLVYTLMGGYGAVAVVDFFQGTFLLVVILAVPLLAWFDLGGSAPIVQAASQRSISLNPFVLSSKEMIEGLIISMSWGVGYMGMPHVLTKFMGIRKPSQVAQGMAIGMSWHFLALCGSVLIGLVGIGYQGLEGEGELLFVKLVELLMHPYLATVIFCAVLAANISTMDSQILVCSTSVGDDLLQRIILYFSPQSTIAQDKKALNRLSMILIALIALAIALGRPPSVGDAVQFSWSGLGASFGPLVLFSLYGKNLSLGQAVSGLATSSVIVVLWSIWGHDAVKELVDIDMPALLPGFIGSIMVMGCYPYRSFFSLRCRK